MRTKLPLLVAIFLNLLVWNYYIIGSWGTFFTLEVFVVIHFVISVVVILLLWLLTRSFLRQHKVPLLLLLSVLVAYLPPAITVWLIYAVPELLQLRFADLLTLLLVAVITAATSWKFWVPLGIANFILLMAYSSKVRTLRE